MKLDATQEFGLLAETDKPTKAPWFLHFAGAILRKNGSALAVGGADKDGLLAKTAKGIVSFLQNFLPSQTQKEVARVRRRRPCRHRPAPSSLSNLPPQKHKFSFGFLDFFLAYSKSPP